MPSKRAAGAQKPAAPPPAAGTRSKPGATPAVPPPHVDEAPLDGALDQRRASPRKPAKRGHDAAALTGEGDGAAIAAIGAIGAPNLLLRSKRRRTVAVEKEQVLGAAVGSSSQVAAGGQRTIRRGRGSRGGAAREGSRLNAEAGGGASSSHQNGLPEEDAEEEEEAADAGKGKGKGRMTAAQLAAGAKAAAAAAAAAAEVERDGVVNENGEYVPRVPNDQVMQGYKIVKSWTQMIKRQFCLEGRLTKLRVAPSRTPKKASTFAPIRRVRRSCEVSV